MSIPLTCGVIADPRDLRSDFELADRQTGIALALQELVDDRQLSLDSLDGKVLRVNISACQSKVNNRPRTSRSAITPDNHDNKHIAQAMKHGREKGYSLQKYVSNVEKLRSGCVNQPPIDCPAA